MRFVAFAGLAVLLAGCSSESAADKALDTASPMANVPSPPPPANKPKLNRPASIGAAGGAAAPAKQ